MTAQDKAREVNDKIKAENAEQEKVDTTNKALAISQLEEISQNSELAKMYGDNAKVGSENLAGELPLLKVHAVGKSNANQLQDGSEPEDGYFFYKPTQEQFKEIECHILTVSRGFRAQGLQEGKGEIFNQLVGGVLLDNGEYKPFIMYFTGLKLSKLWDFGKEANKYTHAKPFPIPMFALKVKLTTEKIANSFGKSWIVNFDIVKNKENVPELVIDPGVFQFLKDSVETAQETITQIIASKTTQQTETIIAGDDDYVPPTEEGNGVPVNMG